MTSRIIFVFGCLAAALFSGCATTTSQVPAELQYAPPPAGTPVAKIKGSEEKSALLDNFTAFVLLVDGKRVMADRKGWDTPIALAEGRHALTVEFNRGVFTAHADFELEAVAGAAYEVKYETDVKLYGSNRYVDFWIVDSATNKAVTSIKRGQVGGARSGGYVPIFIPMK